MREKEKQTLENDKRCLVRMAPIVCIGERAQLPLLRIARQRADKKSERDRERASKRAANDASDWLLLVVGGGSEQRT